MSKFPWMVKMYTLSTVVDSLRGLEIRSIQWEGYGMEADLL